MPWKPTTHKPLGRSARRYQPPQSTSPQAQAARKTAARGYGSKWRKAREAYLRANPFCVEHQRRELLVAATVVDHIEPHRGDVRLFWRRSNWQALCKSCHDRKTAGVDRKSRTQAENE